MQGCQLQQHPWVPLHPLQHSGQQQGTCSAGDMPRSAGRPSVVPMPHKLRPLVCVQVGERLDRLEQSIQELSDLSEKPGYGFYPAAGAAGAAGTGTSTSGAAAPGTIEGVS